MKSQQGGVNVAYKNRKPGRTVRATVLERPTARIYPVKRDGSGWFISLTPFLDCPVDWTNVRGVGLARHRTALDLRVAATVGRLKLPPTYLLDVGGFAGTERGLKAVVPTSWVNGI